MIALAVLAAALPYALKPRADNDLWWHVRSGELIVAERGLPASDPFSFTTAQDAAWVNHEWLADVLLASVYAAGGDSGLTLLRIFLLLATIGALGIALWDRFPQPLLVLTALLATGPLLRIFITLRPHSFTYLFTLLFVLILERSARRPRLLWSLPPLMALWANLHGGFLVGLVVLTVALGCRWWMAGPDRRTLALVFGLTLLAPTLNPRGLALFPYLARELGANHSLILEWRGIWQFAEYRPHFLLLTLLPVLALVASRSWRPAMPIVLFALSVVATCRHARFLVLLTIFASLVTFACLPSLSRRIERAGPSGLLARLSAPRWALAVYAVPVVAAVLQLGVDYRIKGLRLEVDPLRVPVLACEFLERHELGPNLLLKLDWGGYAIWHLFPRYKVSSDGRNLTVYSEEFVDHQLQAYDRGDLAALLGGLDVDTILIENDGPSYRGLRTDSSWTQVYEDRLAAVFVRPEIARTLARHVLPEAEIEPSGERLFFP